MTEKFNELSGLDDTPRRNWSPKCLRRRRYTIGLQWICQEDPISEKIHGHFSSADKIDFIDVLSQVQGQTKRTHRVLQHTQ